MTRRRTGQKRTRTKRPPTISLDGADVIVAGTTWVPSDATWRKMEAAGARHFEATTSNGTRIRFGTAKAAKAWFEAAFVCENDEFGLDDPDAGGLPDDIEWASKGLDALGNG